MGDVLDFERGSFVRFFKEYVDCGWCDQPTRGRVYEESQKIVCSVCNGVLLEIDDEPMLMLTLEEDDFDGSA
jgi:hypothetical protein